MRHETVKSRRFSAYFSKKGKSRKVESFGIFARRCNAQNRPAKTIIVIGFDPIPSETRNFGISGIRGYCVFAKLSIFRRMWVCTFSRFYTDVSLFSGSKSSESRSIYWDGRSSDGVKVTNGFDGFFYLDI